MRRAKGSQTVDDVRDAVRAALIELGDHHSHLILPVKPTSARISPRASIAGEFAYIAVPSFIGSGEASADFARELRHLVMDLAPEASVDRWSFKSRARMFMI